MLFRATADDARGEGVSKAVSKATLIVDGDSSSVAQSVKRFCAGPFDFTNQKLDSKPILTAYRAIANESYNG